MDAIIDEAMKYGALVTFKEGGKHPKFTIVFPGGLKRTIPFSGSPRCIETQSNLVRQDVRRAAALFGVPRKETVLA